MFVLGGEGKGSKQESWGLGTTWSDVPSTLETFPNGNSKTFVYFSSLPGYNSVEYLKDVSD